MQTVGGRGEDRVQPKGVAPVLGEDHVLHGLGERGGISAEAGRRASLRVVVDEQRG